MGEIDLSTITEPQIIVSEDKKTATKYTVGSEIIDLEALRNEKDGLEAQLKEGEPTVEELLEIGKMNHDYFRKDINGIKNRILDIDILLGK